MSQVFLNAGQTPVPATAAVLSQSECAHGQCYVVTDHQQMRGGQRKPVQIILDRLATLIHVSVGLKQHDGPSFNVDRGRLAQAIRTEGSTEPPGQDIQNIKAGVVPGAFVLSARVPQSTYQPISSSQFHIAK